MIPVLYSSTETDFTNNGIGRLADAISCSCHEQRNGTYELKLKYPISGVFFNDLVESNIIFVKPSDGKSPQPFRIYKVEKPINGIVTVSAEHISYQLSNIPVMPFEANSLAQALTGLVSNAAEDCPFTFWTDKTVNSPYSLVKPESMRSQIGGTEGSILDLYGGELEWDKWTIKLHNHRGQNRGVVIRYGVNLTDLTQEKSIEGVYTGLCPYWYGASSETMNEYTLITLPEEVLHAATAANYPYQRTIPINFYDDFDSPPTVAQLRERAQQYMTDNNIGIPKVSLTVSFASLWQTTEYEQLADLQRVNLCDTVTVYFEKLGVNATAKVVETDYDCLLERYNSITLGDTRTNLTDSFTKAKEEARKIVQESSSNFSKEIARATNILAGGLGGFVVFGRNPNGEINEILIMDSNDKLTATNVIRLNQNGIGFSQSGYNGPFRSAWLIDNTFDASEINVINLNASSITGGTIDASVINVENLDASNLTVGTLDASVIEIDNIDASKITTGTIDASHLDISDINAGWITTGIIQDATGTNYWNLDTGEISIQATAVDVGIGARNYIRHSNTLDFDDYYFFFGFNFNNEQALLNGENMEVTIT